MHHHLGIDKRNSNHATRRSPDTLSTTAARTLAEAAQPRGRRHIAWVRNLCRTVIFLLMAVCMWPGSGRAGWIEEAFPDPAAFKGLKSVIVEPVALQNMTALKISGDEIQDRVHAALTKGGINAVKRNRSAGKTRIAPPTADIGALQVTIQRAEAPVFFGSNINNFLISVKLFQRVVLPSTRQDSWAITWFDSRSEIVGTKRPKRIIEIVDELIQLFIQDFIVGKESS